MLEKEKVMDTNIDSTQVNDGDSLPSMNPQSVSEMDDYSDFIGEEDGLENVSFADDDADDSTFAEKKVDGEEEPKPVIDEKATFFQSQYDKAKVENEKLRQELEQVKTMMNPENLRSQMIQDLQKQIAQQQLMQEPEPPVPPALPKEYDQYEAISDPNSESGKYLAAQQNYQKELIKYNKDLVQFNVNKSLFEFKAEQQQMAEQERQRMLSEQQRSIVENNLVTMGMPKDMQTDFGQWLNSTDSIKPIVSLFMQMKQNNTQRKQVNNSQLQRNSSMPNVNMNVGSLSKPMSEQEVFNQGRKGYISDEY
jgi:hypothetical protein